MRNRLVSVLTKLRIVARVPACFGITLLSLTLGTTTIAQAQDHILDHASGNYNVLPELGITAVCGEDPFAEGYEEVSHRPRFPNLRTYTILTAIPVGIRAGHTIQDTAPWRLVMEGRNCFYEIEGYERVDLGSRYSGSHPPFPPSFTMDGIEFPVPLQEHDLIAPTRELLNRCEAGIPPFVDQEYADSHGQVYTECYEILSDLLGFDAYYLSFWVNETERETISIFHGYIYYRGEFLDQW